MHIVCLLLIKNSVFFQEILYKAFYLCYSLENLSYIQVIFMLESISLGTQYFIYFTFTGFNNSKGYLGYPTDSAI